MASIRLGESVSRINHRLDSPAVHPGRIVGDYDLTSDAMTGCKIFRYRWKKQLPADIGQILAHKSKRTKLFFGNP